MPSWSDENGNCHFEVNGVPCYQSPDKCPMHGGSTAKSSKTKTTTELTRLRRENADMARALDEAIQIQKKAVADAYRRGAEAMREAAARTFDGEALNGVLGPYFGNIIRVLPIPEDKS